MPAQAPEEDEPASLAYGEAFASWWVGKLQAAAATGVYPVDADGMVRSDLVDLPEDDAERESAR
jgi:hypothetical protein